MFITKIEFDAANKRTHIQRDVKLKERGVRQTLVRQEAYIYKLVQIQSV